MCSSSGRQFVHAVLYGILYTVIVITVWKTYHTKLDVQMVFLMINTWMFEICTRHQELNYKINLKSVHFVGLRYIIISQCTVQKEHKLSWCLGFTVSFVGRVTYDSRMKLKTFLSTATLAAILWCCRNKHVFYGFDGRGTNRLIDKFL